MHVYQTGSLPAPNAACDFCLRFVRTEFYRFRLQTISAQGLDRKSVRLTSKQHEFSCGKFKTINLSAPE